MGGEQGRGESKVEAEAHLHREHVARRAIGIVLAEDATIVKTILAAMEFCEKQNGQ